MKARYLVHTENKADYERELQLGRFGTKSVEACGFIHCSDVETYKIVSPIYKDDYNEKVILLIDSTKVKPEIKWELSGDREYPHIYGIIDADAIIGVYEHLWSDDRVWIMNEELKAYIED